VQYGNVTFRKSSVVDPDPNPEGQKVKVKKIQVLKYWIFSFEG
jgi:hypothetical protein